MNTSTRPRQCAALVVTAALLFLAGCTPEAPAPIASPTSAPASPTSTPSPTIDTVSAPQPRIDLTCDDLAASLPLTSTFSTAVSPRSRAKTEYSAQPSRPDEYIVRSVGGLVCEFSNGQPEGASVYNPAYVGVRVVVLPEPGAEWERYIALVEDSDNAGGACIPDDVGTTRCSLRVLSANRGIEVYIAGAVSEAAGTALADAALSAVTSAGPGGAAWTPPAETLSLPAECETYITGASVQAITGLATAFTVISVRGGAGGYNLRFAAEEINGSPACFFRFALDDGGLGSLYVLRGGEWAWAEAQTIVGATPITVAGLGADDEAWLRCGPADAWCVVDLMLGGNWIELYLTPIQTEDPFDRRTAVQAIAATVVANVAP